ILHTSCSCRLNPSTNLALCDPMCLDASSPDNTTGIKGTPSPLWTLVGLKDPTLGTETCGGTVGGECNHDLPAPTTASCLGKITVLSLQYNGGGCAAMGNSQAKDQVKCTQPVNNPTASPVRLLVTDGGGTVWLDTGSPASVLIGDVNDVKAASVPGKTTLASNTAVQIFDASG